MKVVSNDRPAHLLRFDTFGRLLDCYYCGEPMFDDTVYMHEDCWHISGWKIHAQAQDAVRWAMQNRVSCIEHTPFVLRPRRRKADYEGGCEGS